MLYFTFVVRSKSNAIITLTEGDKNEWNFANKTFVIPNIITEISNKISSCSNKKVISVGRLTYQKGFESPRDDRHLRKQQSYFFQIAMKINVP